MPAPSTSTISISWESWDTFSPAWAASPISGPAMATARNAGMTVTMGNPGANTSLSYIGTVGTIVISESVGVPSLSYLAGWDKAGDGKGNFAFIARGVPDYNSTYLEDAAASVGFLFISDASNYFALPTYLFKEMSSLQSLASDARVPSAFMPRMLVPL